MRPTIPTQLILLAVLASLAVTGWIYIYSCRKMIQMELQTITGDPSCLEDKQLDILFSTNYRSHFPDGVNLDIGFSSGPVLESVSCERLSNPYYYDDLLLYYDSFGYLEVDYSDHNYILEYNELSEKWIVNESNGLKWHDVLDFNDKYPDAAKVVGVYEVGTENAIVILTVENKTDLYASVYNRKSKTNHDPVLIFQSDSEIHYPVISRKNNTCPMGSIVVYVEGSKCYAVALGKDEIDGSVEPICYNITQTIPKGIGEFHDISAHNPFFLDYSEIFYCGEEIWIIYDSWYNSSSSNLTITLDSPNCPYSSLRANEKGILGIKHDIIFYEGILSINPTVANNEEALYQYRSVGYGLSSKGTGTWIDFY